MGYDSHITATVLHSRVVCVTFPMMTVTAPQLNNFSKVLTVAHLYGYVYLFGLGYRLRVSDYM